MSLDIFNFDHLRNLPPILDFEASSLSDCSYPISVGLCISGELKYWIIKPNPDWVDWSLESQAIHGIKRSHLVECGANVSVVCQELTAALQQYSVVYSDNPYWELRWLNVLGNFDIEVRNVKEIISTDDQDKWEAVFQSQFKTYGLIAHRADHDALANALTLQALLNG